MHYDEPKNCFVAPRLREARRCAGRRGRGARGRARPGYTDAARRADAADGGRRVRWAAHAQGDAGGDRRSQRSGGTPRSQSRAGSRGRSNQPRVRRARRAQAHRRDQGASDHGHLGIGRHYRGSATLLGEQDVPDHRLRRRFHYQAAAPGLPHPHPTQQLSPGGQACGVHRRARREALFHDVDPGAVFAADAGARHRGAQAERVGDGGHAHLRQG